jgi:hypothetical protein
MFGVLAESIGRDDLLILRNVSNRYGVHWQRMSNRAEGFQDVDLTDWDCVFELLSPDEQDVWYRRPCDAHGTDGKAVVYIPPDAFSGIVWQSRRTGCWRMTASKDGTTELLGWGYFSLQN